MFHYGCVNFSALPSFINNIFFFHLTFFRNEAIIYFYLRLLLIRGSRKICKSG